MTGYTLALASVISLTGWAADRFGTKRLYLLAVLLFTAGSVLCATILLIVAFVSWALSGRNIDPLVELRLFKNKDMTVAVIAMMLFALAFFGASLLFALYFIQVRGEDALGAGLLLAPQGVGAMITMPIAGILADKIGPGKIVLGPTRARRSSSSPRSWSPAV